MARPDISRRQARRKQVVEQRPQTEDNFYEAMPVATPLAGRREVVINETSVADDHRGLYLAERVVSYIVGIIASLLALRLVLELFSYFGVISTATGFARFIYGLTQPLVAPFVGMFTSSTGDASAWTIAFAMLVYAIVGYAIVKLIQVAEARDY